VSYFRLFSYPLSVLTDNSLENNDPEIVLSLKIHSKYPDKARPIRGFPNVQLLFEQFPKRKIKGLAED
jgi:hypothetical protein